MSAIPDDHPRADSLRTRHAIIDGMHKKIVAEAGLIAHGRGEAFDYLIGERTIESAKEAIKAASAMLYLAKHPVISVNGNTCVLCLKDMIEFSKISGIRLEVNLFYRSPDRIKAINELFEYYDFPDVLGFDEKYRVTISELSSQRRIVDKRGIYVADVVLVPLEDGDRSEALIKLGKKVITIDLNPLSRTSLNADITIVDNVIRVFPILSEMYMKINSTEQAKKIIKTYNNKKTIVNAMETISSHWKKSINE